MIVQHPILSQFTEITHFCTTRNGGVSEGNYSSFNQSYFSGDNAAAVTQNRQKLLEVTNLHHTQLVVPFQTHGNIVKLIDESFLNMPNNSQTDYLHGVDALVTNLPNICIAIATADCVPLLFYDPIKSVCGAAHAGWRGTVTAIAANTVKCMTQQYGCNAKDIYTVIGPSISPKVYEVGEDVINEFAIGGFPIAKISQPLSPNKYLLNLWESNRYLLEQEGIPSTQIFIAEECTFTKHHQYFSARRLGIQSGRMLSGICINK